jgi:hypothetical protein
VCLLVVFLMHVWSPTLSWLLAVLTAMVMSFMQVGGSLGRIFINLGFSGGVLLVFNRGCL